MSSNKAVIIIPDIKEMECQMSRSITQDKKKYNRKKYKHDTITECREYDHVGQCPRASCSR
jgi:hypothetical protein